MILGDNDDGNGADDCYDYDDDVDHYWLQYAILLYHRHLYHVCIQDKLTVDE